MSYLHLLTSNYILNVSLLSWAAAQLLKTLIHFLITKKFNAERLVGAGGMPSSHSALVCSLVIAMARKEGFTSPLFAMAIIFAVVVMYDAMGVRRAAGEQAKVLNKIVFNFNKLFDSSDKDTEPDENDLPERELKEYLGHTPLEVLGGALLGILIAMLFEVK